MKRLIVMMIILAFVSGCVFNTNNSNSETLEKTKIFKGTKGIQMNFMDDAPPTTIYTTSCTGEICQSESMKLMLQIENIGANDLTGGHYYISGFNPSLWTINTEQYSIDELKGKSMEYPTGEQEVVTPVEALTVKIPKNTDQYSTTLMVSACYPYTTYATADVCIDPDPTIDENDVCQVSDISMSGGQGAPVTVTNIKSDATINTAIFSITVKNAGGGDVLEDLENCLNIPIGKKDVIEKINIKLGGKDVTERCKPEKPRLYDDQTTFHCTIPVEGSSSYTSILEIQLDYNYRSDIMKSFNVKQINS